MTTTTRGRVKVEVSGKRVRVLFAGRIIADSTRPKLVWEKPYYPTYYFPVDDVATDALAATGATKHSPSRGDADVQDVVVGDRTAQGAAWWYTEPPIEDLASTIRFEWDAMDAWFEEDEQVYVHPRDPYKRIDILQGSRHIRVEVDGVTIADSTSPRLLFETSLPTRYYLPKTDVRLDLLTPTEHVTHCPYKGDAEYYTVTTGDATHENLMWWYRHPTRESEPIAGYVSFYNEKVDLYVDGQLQERPRTPFS